jgi:hypothetical protein
LAELFDDRLGVVGHGQEGGGGDVGLEPLGVAAFFPFGEVLVADGFACEVALEDGLDFGHGVEPEEEEGAGFAIEDAEVELFADGVGEACDFS